jgi:prolipoprotein diacylglyceryltransferase
MLYIGCVVGIYAGAAVAADDGLSGARFALVAVALLAPALIGARLWFVLQHLGQFRADPSRIWRRAQGGSALYGGLVLSVLVSVPVLDAAGLPFLGFWDGGSVTMVVGLIFTRFGCLVHGCCAGHVTNGRIGLWLPNTHGVWARRFPTQIVEATWGLVLLASVLLARASLATGGIFALLLGGYAAGRLLLEPTREGSLPRPAGANVVVSALLVAAACAFFIAR